MTKKVQKIHLGALLVQPGLQKQTHLGNARLHKSRTSCSLVAKPNKDTSHAFELFEERVLHIYVALC